jgi:hypothetical protein
MNSLTPDTLDAFLRRFSRLNDGVIRHIEFVYPPSGKRHVAMTLSLKDAESSSGWSNLLLRMNSLSEFVLREGRTTCQILSDGVSIRWINGTIFVSFSSFMPSPETAAEFRQSDCYGACLDLSWDVVPYAES